MISPRWYPWDWYTLESVRVLHSFFEWSALLSFVAVVGLDAFLHWTEKMNGLKWNPRWKEHTWTGSIWRLPWSFRVPAYNDTLDLRWLCKKLSILGFALAILLEIAALPYSERSDQLTDLQLDDSRKQALSALTFAVNANKGSQRATGSALDAVRQARDVSDRAKQLAVVIKAEHLKVNGMVEDLKAEEKAAAADAANLEAEKKKRAELAASLLPRQFIDQSEALVIIGTLPRQSLIFEFISEHEPQRIAEEIHFVFSGWKVFRRRIDERLISDGISLCIGETLPAGSLMLIDPEAPRREYLAQRGATEAAANTLLNGLHHSGIDARVGDTFCRVNELPPSTLLVMIGEKPNHVLEQTINELGLKPGTFGNVTAGSNRAGIPDEILESGKSKP